MRFRSVVLTAGLFFAAATMPSAAYADTIAFSFTGTVTSASGFWAGQGLAVTGSFSYDDGLLDSDPSSTNDVFLSHTPAANQALSSGWGITVTVGAITRSTTNNANVPTTLHHVLTIRDHVSEDRFELNAVRPFPADDRVRLLLRDFAPSPPDGIAVGSGGLTGTPPTDLDLSLFSDTAALSFYRSYDAQGIFQGRVIFTLTGVNRIPEPTSLLLLALGVGVLMRRRKRAA
jgi:hypothetical protein